MHHRAEQFLAIDHGTRRTVRRLGRLAAQLMAIASVLGGAARAQEMMPGMDSVVDPGAPPMTEMGGGDFFSQDLGTMLRVRYSTESYGQRGDGNGNLDIGSMQVVSFEDAIAFFDGQVTLNDVQGVGFNVGLGYRWLSGLSLDGNGGQVLGMSVWADGTSTEASNFFPQVGISFESLGDMWDMRLNGYIPVGEQDQVGKFAPIGQIGFEGNNISELTEAVVDTSFYVGEAEIARRLGMDRDAWVFAGPYFLANDEDDTAGYRVGVRGYAYPDLLLQFAVTDDDIFNTNATFSLIWFVGRTRTDFRPTGGVPDRLREPVMRNDYVALTQSTTRGGIALTGANGDPLRVVHVNSSAGAGGTGTFENPLNNLEDVFANSQVGDIILAHAESSFTGQEVVLRNRQRFLGEGDGLTHTVVTTEEGTIDLPETFEGAGNLDRPMILAATGDAITLRDSNEVANFDIDGQNVTARAIAPSANGAGNPNLHDLSISNTTGDAIAIESLLLTDTDDIDNDNNTTEQFVRNNVTISDVTFDNIGGDDIDIDASTTADVTDPTVTLQETIAVTDVTSTNGNGAGLRLANTHSAGNTTITNYTNGNATAGSGGGLAGQGVLRFEGTGSESFAGDLTISNADIRNNIGFAFDFLNVATTSSVTLGTSSSYDGGAGAAGGIRMDNFDGTFTASSTTLTNGTLAGVSVIGGSDGTITFQDTVTFESIDGTAFDVNGFTGTLAVNSDIENDTGRSVSVQGVSDASTSVTFNGDITDTGQGLLVSNNTGGTILFSGDFDFDTTTNNAITLTNNTGADINFGGTLDLTTTSGAGFTATGGGMLTASNTNNTITTATGRITEISGMEISNLGVNFGEITRTAAGATSAVRLEDNTDGPIVLGTLGDDPGESGTIAGGLDDAIVINDSANVTVSGLVINNTNAVSGVRVEKFGTANSTVNLNDLQINAGDIGVEVIGGGTGSLTMTVNDTDALSSTATGLSFNNVDVGTVQVNNATVDGNGAAATAGIRVLNSNASLTFDNETVVREVSGTDFEVDGGTGTVTMNGDITNTAGRSINVQNISGGTVSFGANNALTDSGTGIRIASNTGGTINLLGTYDLDTAANDAVTITNNTGATISIGQLDIDTTTGDGFVATGGGTLSVTGNANTITSAGGRGLNIENMTIGSVDFESVNATGGDNGIRLVNNTGGTITVGDAGNAVDAGGIITGTTDAGVHVTNTNVVLNGVTVRNAGNAAGENAVEIFHTNSTAMNSTFNRLSVNNQTRDGVVVDGTGGSGTFNANFQNLAVNVTGDGLVVDDGVTLTAGGTNTIASATGVGLQLNDIAISSSSANFESVTVTNGATNGIVITDVTTAGAGQVAVTGTGTTQNSGGALTTTGTAVVLSNVQNVDLRNVRVVNGANGVDIDHTNTATTAMDVTLANLNLDGTSGDGIILVTASDAFNFAMRLTDSDLENNVAMAVTGAGQFGLLVEDTDIDAGGADIAFTLAFGGNATDGDVTIRDNNRFAANTGQALFVDSSDATAKDIKLLVEDSMFLSNAVDPAAEILSRGNTLMNLTVQGNQFDSLNAADDLEIQSNGAQARLRLALGGDDSSDFNSANGAGTMIVRELGGSDFSIFEVTDTVTNDTRNFDPVDTDPNDAAFDDLAVPPTLPTVP